MAGRLWPPPQRLTMPGPARTWGGAADSGQHGRSSQIPQALERKNQRRHEVLANRSPFTGPSGGSATLPRHVFREQKWAAWKRGSGVQWLG